MSFTSLLNNTVKIFRPTKTGDGQGGFTQTRAEIDEVRGRIRPASASETLVAEKWDALVTHVLYILPGANIQRSDEVETQGKLFRVQAVREPSLMGHHLEVDLELVQIKDEQV